MRLHRLTPAGVCMTTKDERWDTELEEGGSIARLGMARPGSPAG
jgi:hypothetical protein